LAGTPVVLLPQRALLIKEIATLILGDLHLGKAMHFRKAGISFPQASASKDYTVLQQLMEIHQPKEVYFLGDLFHSSQNTEWLQFENFVKSHSNTKFVLIKGNHDILKKEVYESLQLEVIPQQLTYKNLIFSHEPLKEITEGKINIIGHIHPGCVIRGLGKQYLRLPCFYFKQQTFVLPAFGQLTGLQILEHTKEVNIYAVLPDKVVKL